MKNRPGKEAKSTAQGFTLLETLLATAIIILILSTIFAVWHTTMRVHEGQEQRIQGPLAGAQTLETITHDISCALLSPNQIDPALLLNKDSDSDPDQPTMSKITFFTTKRNAQRVHINNYTIEKRTYEVITDEMASILYCIHQPTVGPGLVDLPQTNLILKDISAFNIEVYDGEQWQTRWPPKESMDRLPRAARISLVIQNKKQTTALETETLIAAGNLVTSRLTRSTSPSL